MGFLDLTTCSTCGKVIILNGTKLPNKIWLCSECFQKLGGQSELSNLKKKNLTELKDMLNIKNTSDNIQTLNNQPISTADEILKLKELLDQNIITQEEFEKKKEELLNTNVKSNIQNNNVPNNSHKVNKNKNSGCSGAFIIILVIIAFICIVGSSTDKQYEKTKNNNNANADNANAEVVENYTSYEEFDKIIKECGYSNYSVEDGGEENGIHYFIVRENNVSSGVDIANGTIVSIDYAGHKLYENGQVINKFQDFILTKDEEYEYIDHAKEIVKSQLNYPDTAKFPWLYDEYFVTYTDKNNVTVKGNVTASNAFGVPTTYTFEVTYSGHTATNVNLY